MFHDLDNLPSESPLLAVRDLSVSFSNGVGPRIQAVDGVSFTVYGKQTLAVVGESGSGKSVTALTLMGLLPQARVDSGAAQLTCKDGRVVDVLRASEPELRALRGGDVAMIFQEPMTSLNPVEPVGAQIVEAIHLHTGLPGNRARDAAVQAMVDVGIQNPSARFHQYPHEFSGGMRQRIMIAIALACGPRLLLADEPTTALDVTIQAQVLELIASLQRERGLGVVLITHDMGIVAQHADVVCVMYAGRIVEYAPADRLFGDPKHPYTRGLFSCIPSMSARRERLATVREYVEHPGNFAVSTPGTDLVPWWPWVSGHLEEGYALTQVKPDHWVATFRAGLPPSGPPDTSSRRRAAVVR